MNLQDEVHYGGDACMRALEQLPSCHYGPAVEFCRCNIIKYLWRLGNKEGADVLKDAKKVLWYAQRMAESIERRQQPQEVVDSSHE